MLVSGACHSSTGWGAELTSHSALQDLSDSLSPYPWEKLLAVSNVLRKAWSLLWLLVGKGDQSLWHYSVALKPCLAANSEDDNPSQPYRGEVKTSVASKGRWTQHPAVNTETLAASPARPWAEAQLGTHSVMHTGPHTKGRQVSTIMTSLAHPISSENIGFLKITQLCYMNMFLF